MNASAMLFVSVRSAIVSLLIVLVGCGGGGQSSSSSSTPPPTPPDVTGNWYVTATSSVTTKSVNFDGSIVGSQLQLAATLWEDNANNSNCTAGFLWVFSGTESGTALSLTTTPANSQGNGSTLSASLQASQDGSSLNGSYSVAGGCDHGDQGSMVGTRVPSVTGSWSGVVDGGPQAVTAALTQASAPGPPIGNYGVTVNGDSFPLSGTIAFPNWQCFTSGALDQSNSGAQGNTVFVRLVASTGEVLTADGVVTDPATANSITLSYGVESGVCAGQRGSLALTR
ncbi:MAG: hypothetical protein WB711_19065 [Terriglobales bacterium]